MTQRYGCVVVAFSRVSRDSQWRNGWQPKQMDKKIPLDNDTLMLY